MKVFHLMVISRLLALEQCGSVVNIAPCGESERDNPSALRAEFQKSSINIIIITINS
jgi:hypothetical protein